ncbi:MAG: AAA family ATPase, partial [Kiritimatiellaeota bacterium]|nr:AAA family ATPase [Kiritimatiellota bacterium]
MVGTVTFKRLLRVCMQRWITLAVFVFVGLLGAFTVFKMSPTIYEATSVFEMNVRRPTIMGGREGLMELDSYENMQAVFNTRIRRFRSEEFFTKIIAKYRATNPDSTLLREQLFPLLEKSKLTLQKESKLVQVAVRAEDSKLSQELANIYMDVVLDYTSDLNRQKSVDAIKWLNFEAEREKGKRDRAHQDVFDYRVEHKIDLLKNQNQMNQQALAQLNVDIIALQRQVASQELLRNALEAIKDTPERFGSLPSAVPHANEIMRSFQRLESALAEKNSLLARYTALHPEVKVKEREVEGFETQFADTVHRALETSQADLNLSKQQLSLAESKRDDLIKTTYNLELQIVTAQMKTDELIYERGLIDDTYQGLLLRIREAQYAADENTAIIQPVEPARLPNEPVLPMPFVIFSAGPVLGLMLGILFVLLVDHLEDKITGISDIEQRLRLKPLVVLPHLRKMKREQIARLVSRDKFSQFAEAVASLRNLLDSPRYVEMSKVLLCVSTQPGEGKTITSCNLAISCALSGEKTLLIDFDMRRPRIARIFEKANQEFTSLPHTLAKADPSLFPSLPMRTDVENLDVVCSKSSSEISPASLMGSGAIVEFFKWARENYDRIVVDSPPFGVVGDVMTLWSLVDAVMIMCCP